MRTKLVPIGNSQGVRIPRHLIEEAGLSGELELLLDGDSIILRNVENPRDGWVEAFRKMAERGDDALIDPEVATEWDLEEWEWK